MHHRLHRISRLIAATLLLAALSPVGLADGPASVRSETLAVRSRTVVGGGPSDFVHVRHVVLRGSNYQIGRHLAELARDRHDVRPNASVDAGWTRAQLRYFERYWPQHVERMRGAAAAFGGSLDDHSVNYSTLDYGFTDVGCSVVFYPPHLTSSGQGILSRNFDFTTGTFDGRRPGPGEVAICAAPYVLEMYPDAGYPTLFICCYDLLSGAIDGVNSEGLALALLADDELMRDGSAEPVEGSRAGFGVVEITRYLLETCATVDEAIAALQEAKLYYRSIPCHYIIADASGRSVVWENSRTMNRGHVIEGNDAAQLTTNFMLHRHPDPEALPEDSHPHGSFRRYRAMRQRIAEAMPRLDLDEIKAVNDCVAATTGSPPEPWAPHRTLWHSVYVPGERSMSVSFYLGDDADGVVRRSAYVDFGLDAD